ncbi:hypothetical protein SRHO_G00325000 [Serrasalmus rhombeus]
MQLSFSFVPTPWFIIGAPVALIFTSQPSEEDDLVPSAPVICAMPHSGLLKELPSFLSYLDDDDHQNTVKCS